MTVEADAAARISGYVPAELTEKAEIEDHLGDRFDGWTESRQSAFADAIEDMRKDGDFTERQPDPDQLSGDVTWTPGDGSWRDESGRFADPKDK